MSELPAGAAAAGAASGEAAADEASGVAEPEAVAEVDKEPEEPPSGSGAIRRSDRRMLLWGIPGGIALAAIGSYLGYLARPLSPSPRHPGMAQGLELSGMIFCGVLLVCLAIVCVQAARPARPATGHEEAAGEDPEKEPQELPYDFRAGQRERHLALIWAVPVTAAVAAVGAVLGYAGFPGLTDARQSFAGKLAAGSAGFLGLLTLLLIGGCIWAAWPARVYGPRRELPALVRVLRLIGFWLAMFPFSAFSLLALAAGIYQGVNGAWVKMIILLTGGLVFGAACCFLLAGSGALRGEELRPGGEVPHTIRTSPWWRHFRRMLTLWALFVTVSAAALAIQRDWGDCADMAGTAFASWIARVKAGSGEMPEETFRL